LSVNQGCIKLDSIDYNEILYVRLYKERFLLLLTNPWFCKYVNVTSPDGKLYQFPCYLWLSGFRTIEIPEAKGKVYAEGTPYCIDAGTSADLPPNEQYSLEKLGSFGFTLASAYVHSNKPVWFKMDSQCQMWKEDTFFGYQYLNGVNPMSVRKCTKIPDNFPVTQDMVASTLGSSTDLQKELKSGNIFLADYNILEGIPTNTINGKKQYLAAPLCLLWKSLQDYLIPIAIQLGQQPGPENPIFVASDSEWDWTIAKIWVRYAEVQVHELDHHLLRTHLLAELFSIATSRNLPTQHPLFKLLLPHFRYTLEINVLARTQLIGPGGLFDKAFVTGNGSVPILVRKALERMTYTSLCLPDDLKDRGMESIPKHYYKEDDQVWFVSDVVNHYYKDDDMVSKDPELQAWIKEIFIKGFLERESSGKHDPNGLH
uniref:Lipoxygenase domain-containing protein n=1 Tax=Leptobrachium leishanense TaxID=445787 RepID=A0A8C5PUK5_9ANUR